MPPPRSTDPLDAIVTAIQQIPGQMRRGYVSREEFEGVVKQFTATTERFQGALDKFSEQFQPRTETRIFEDASRADREDIRREVRDQSKALELLRRDMEGKVTDLATAISNTYKSTTNRFLSNAQSAQYWPWYLIIGTIIAWASHMLWRS